MQTHVQPLTSPSLGSQRLLTSFHFGPQDTGRKIYLQASLHADELPGMLTAWHLKQRLLTLESAGLLRAEIVLVPVANPIGLNQNLHAHLLGRHDLASGQNFNRHYPALADAVFADIRPHMGASATENARLARQSLSRQLARLIPQSELDSLRLTLMKMACDAEVVLDLHCDFRADLHLYTGTPLWPRCEPLARYLGACATLLATESGDQPFDEACSQLWWQLAERAEAACPGAAFEPACLAVTIELRGQANIDHELAKQDAEGILHYMRHIGVIAEAAPTLPALRYPATPLAGSEDLRAPHAGILVYHAKPGSLLAHGDLIAEVIDPLSDWVSEIRAQRSGVLYATSVRSYAITGMNVAKVASAEAFKHGKLLTA